jgi:hypothetical protein
MHNPENGREKPPPPSLRVKLAVVAASVVVALLIFEVFLRAVGFTYPVFYQPDASRGYSLRPGMEGRYRKEGEAFVKINSDGLRDREHSKEKPAGTLRIAVVGDSYAEAFQVDQEKAFWSVMERRLQACPSLGGRRVEVINFGVSGYGTAQELITLRERVWAYSPDVVLLALTTNNDVLDNSRALKLADEIPYFNLRDGRLVLDDSFRDARSFRLRDSALNRAGRWLRDHLRFVQAAHLAQVAIKSRLDAWRDRRRAEQQKQGGALARPPSDMRLVVAASAGDEPQPPARQQGAPAEEPGAANVIYREPPDDAWRDAWAVTEKLLATMNAEVREHGARFYVATLSNGIQVYPDPQARRAFAERLGVEDLFYPERRFRALGEREGFPVLNLAPELQLYADEHKVFLHGFGRELGNGHWNEGGHRVAGETLAQNLCEWLAREGGGDTADETPQDDGRR